MLSGLVNGETGVGTAVAGVGNSLSRVGYGRIVGVASVSSFASVGSGVFVGIAAIWASAVANEAFVSCVLVGGAVTAAVAVLGIGDEVAVETAVGETVVLPVEHPISQTRQKNTRIHRILPMTRFYSNANFLADDICTIYGRFPNP